MKTTLVILIFLGFAQLSIATPDEGIRERETLIGYNDDSYFCVQVIRYPFGTYYARKDSAFMIERDFHSGQIKSKIFISSRHHRDKTASGDWETKLYENKDFNFVNFISDYDIKYLYPNVYKHAAYEMLILKMELDGLKARVNWEFKKVYETDSFNEAAPWIKEFLNKQNERNKKYPNLKPANYITTNYSNGDDKYIFITVSGECNAEYFQIIYALEREKIESRIGQQ